MKTSIRKYSIALFLFVVLCANAATITSPVITTTYSKTTDTNPLIIMEQPAKFTFDFSSSSLTGSENLVIYFWSPASYFPTGSSVALKNEGNKIWSLSFTPTVFFNKSAAEIAQNTSQFWFNIQNPANSDLTGSLHVTYATPIATAAPVLVLGNPSGTYALDAPVTWTFDLSNAGFKAGQDVYMYAWSPSAPDPNYSNSTALSKLTYVGGMKWNMTLTPTSYFGKTIAEIQASSGFWMKLKDQTGKIETATFNVPYTISGNTQNFYFDFGPKDGTNGDETTTADSNGNYWNNISNAAGSTAMPLSTFSNLKNSSNAQTPYSLTFSGAQFVSNGKLNGGLLSPYASQMINAPDLAIPTATEDYIYTQAKTSGPVITFGGLDTKKRYKFKIFGSRNTTSDRTSQFTLQGDGLPVVGSLASSTAAGLGGTVYINPSITYPTTLNVSYSLTSQGTNTKAVTYYGNNNNVYVSSMVTPDASGNISLTTVATSTDAYAYINALKIEEYDIIQVDATAISITGNNISAAGATSQLSVVYTPSNATSRVITWTVDDNSIATISSTGLLTPKKNGNVTVTASFVQNAQTISASKQISIINQITELYLTGTATQAGASISNALAMTQVMGTTTNFVNGMFEISTTLNASGTLRFVSSKTDANPLIYGAGTSSGTLALNAADIIPNVSGEVLIRVNLATATYKIYPINPLKISQMGSSVSFGWGATNNQGYAYRYNQLLSDRFTAGIGAGWSISNISIGGNATPDLLNRWESDLLNDNSKYVVYALSLGNEGIMGGGQAKFDQFKNNMQLLINKARSAGKIPIVANCYANGGYTAVEYNFVKQMNQVINDWDVPSYNFLGADEDETGKWVTGYVLDAAHPNTDGHIEFFHAIVPSLFDALGAGKPQPVKQTVNTWLSAGRNVSTDNYKLTPEDVLHSFTNVIDVRTTSTGVIATFTSNNAQGLLRIETNGMLTYSSPSGISVTNSTAVNDGQWHKVTLTHYYALGKSILYVDNIQVGSVAEKLVPTEFVINTAAAPTAIDYRDWMLYRSGMNANEIAALNAGKMLKSSLEIYAPLDGFKLLSNDVCINLAQSTNKIQQIPISTQINNKSTTEIKIYPNPVGDKLNIIGFDSNDVINCRIYAVDGREAVLNTIVKNNQLDVSILPPSLYCICFTNIHSNITWKSSFFKK